jgi:8-oxo-dGTP diphosphatase
MLDLSRIQRTAIGAACAIFDGEDRILLVHHTYGRLNWELPGGLAETGEAPAETARRELLEETGLKAEPTRLTGVYFDPGHDFGQMLHFVFRCAWHAGLDPVVASPEISEAGYWPLGELPTPISDFTERRIQDALAGGTAHFASIGRRTWRE